MGKMLTVSLWFLVLGSLIIGTTSFKANVTILHFNDINSQIAPFNESDPTKFGNLSYGGLASLVNLLEEEENAVKNASATKNVNVFRIAAGNLVGGENGWLSIIESGWEKFGNLVPDFYKPHIMGFGLKEFEGGLKKLNQYSKYSTNASIKAMINNVNCVPFLNGSKDIEEQLFCQNYTMTNATILNVTSIHGNDTFKLGVVGFVDPLVESLSDPGKLSFQDPADALARAVAAAPNITTFIAVGSGSMKIAKDILHKVDKIKVVVLAGGSEEMSPDKYPVKEGNGYIVKAGNFGTTFGKLVLEIDSETSASVAVIESKLTVNNANNSTKPDALAAEARVQQLQQIVSAADEIKAGKTLVKLNGTRGNCWSMGCNLGNLIADAMVHCALPKTEPAEATTIGVWPSGSMFDNIVEVGEISKLDMHKWLPHHNQVYLVSVNGSTLKRVFNSSGEAINKPANWEKNWGQFLQVSSGIEVNYSAKGVLDSLRVYQMNDSQLIFENASDSRNYCLVIPSLMYSGRSVYDYLPSLFAAKKIDIGSGSDCLYNYIKAIDILAVDFDDRIKIGDGGSGGSGGSCQECTGADTSVTVILTLVIFISIVGVGFVGWKFVWPRIARRAHSASFP